MLLRAWLNMFDLGAKDIRSEQRNLGDNRLQICINILINYIVIYD